MRGFLRAGVMKDGLVSAIDEETPQAGPLSPVSSLRLRSPQSHVWLKFCGPLEAVHSLLGDLELDPLN